MSFGTDQIDSAQVVFCFNDALGYHERAASEPLKTGEAVRYAERMQAAMPRCWQGWCGVELRAITGITDGEMVYLLDPLPFNPKFMLWRLEPLQ